MRKRLAILSMAVAAVIAFSSWTFGQTGERSGAPGPQAAKPTDPHDLSGIWVYAERMGGGVRAHGAFGPDVPSMTAWAQARFDAAKPGYGPRGAPDGNDPIGKCDPNGLPRLILQGFPTEFVQLPGRLIIFHEWSHAWRTIWMDGRKLPEDPDPTWFGYSVGKWDGDTLVIETIGFNDKTWVDFFGHPHSDEMRLTERYRRADHDTMQLNMTIDDSKAYTKPWASDTKIFKLNPKGELRESLCVASEEDSFTQRIRNPAAGKGSQ
jgi:hypothetical protein